MAGRWIDGAERMHVVRVGIALQAAGVLGAIAVLGLLHALAADGLLRVSSMRRATPGEAAIFPRAADAEPDGEGPGRVEERRRVVDVDHSQ